MGASDSMCRRRLGAQGCTRSRRPGTQGCLRSRRLMRRATALDTNQPNTPSPTVPGVLQLLAIIDRTSMAENGRFYDWQGAEVEW